MQSGTTKENFPFKLCSDSDAGCLNTQLRIQLLLRLFNSSVILLQLKTQCLGLPFTLTLTRILPLCVMTVKLRQNFTKMPECSWIRGQKKIMLKVFIVYEI